MRLLIAIVTCHKYANRADEQRRTWVPEAKALGIDVVFFIGRGEGAIPEDTVQLDVPDDYHSLPVKVQAMFRWADERKYDFVMKTDDDVLVHPDRLLQQIRPRTEYMGHSNGRYASGFAYVVSQQAVATIARAVWDNDPSEDKWVGGVLSKAFRIEDNPYFIIYRFQLGYRCRGHWRGSINGWEICPQCKCIGQNASVICPNNTTTWVEKLHKEFKEKQISAIGSLPIVR